MAGDAVGDKNRAAPNRVHLIVFPFGVISAFLRGFPFDELMAGSVLCG